MVAGGRSERTVAELFGALPAEYRDGAIFLTDFWPAYRAALPDGRHGERVKRHGLTSHAETFGCAPRERGTRCRAQDAVVLEVPAEPRWHPLVLPQSL
jgi:IS1 family transposase